MWGGGGEKKRLPGRIWHKIMEGKKSVWVCVCLVTGLAFSSHLLLEIPNVPLLFWLWICRDQFFHSLFLAFLWTFQWQHYDDIWDAIVWPLCMLNRIKAGYFLKRPPSHPLLSSLLACHFISPSFPDLNSLITWGDAALMLTPSKKKKKKSRIFSLFICTKNPPNLSSTFHSITQLRPFH